MKLYYYPACSTCRKAITWLKGNAVDVTMIDLKSAPPSASELRSIVERSELPIRAFFNTSGKSYRDGGFKDRVATMTIDEAVAALASDGMLIKRPILVGDPVVLVGFREAAWQEALVVA